MIIFCYIAIQNLLGHPVHLHIFSLDRRRIRIWSVSAKPDQCWRDFPRAFDWTYPRTPDGRPGKILGTMQETKVQLKFYSTKSQFLALYLRKFHISDAKYGD